MDWEHSRPFPARSASDGGQAVEVHEGWWLEDGTPVMLRAARDGDEALIQRLVRGLSLQSRYYRYFHPLHELPPAMLARATWQEPRAGVTLLAIVREQGVEVVVAMAEYVAVGYPAWCEFAVVVADQWQRRGIATRMLHALDCIARGATLERMEGDVLAENKAMLRLLTGLGFRLGPHPDGPSLRKARKDLEQAGYPCQALARLPAQLSSQAPGMRRAAPAPFVPTRPSIRRWRRSRPGPRPATA